MYLKCDTLDPSHGIAPARMNKGINHIVFIVLGGAPLSCVAGAQTDSVVFCFWNDTKGDPVGY